MELKQKGNHTWWSKIDISGFENNVEVEFFVEKNCKPDQGQIDDVKWLARHFKKIKIDIERGVYEWYEQSYEFYKTGEWTLDFVEIPLKSSSEIWAYLKEPEIYSSFQFQQRELSLYFSADWNSERDVEISFTNHKIDYIGQAR